MTGCCLSPVGAVWQGTSARIGELPPWRAWQSPPTCPPQNHSPPPTPPAATARALVLFATGCAYAAVIKVALVAAAARGDPPVPHPAVAVWNAVGVVAAGAALAAAGRPPQVAPLVHRGAAVRPAIAGGAWMVGIMLRVAAVSVIDVVPATV